MVKRMVQIADLYEILDITPDATQEQIEAAYRQKTDPTQFPVSWDPISIGKQSLVIAAYRILSDTSTRDLYDGRRSGQPIGGYAGVQPTRDADVAHLEKLFQTYKREGEEEMQRARDSLAETVAKMEQELDRARRKILGG